MLAALCVSGKIPNKLIERRFEVFGNRRAIHVQRCAFYIARMLIGKFDNDRKDYLIGNKNIGVIRVVCRGLARDLQRRRDEDRVGRLNIHAEGLIGRGDVALRRVHVDAERMIAGRGKRGGIRQRVDMAKRRKIDVGVR